MAKAGLIVSALVAMAGGKLPRLPSRYRARAPHNPNTPESKAAMKAAQEKRERKRLARLKEKK